MYRAIVTPADGDVDTLAADLRGRGRDIPYIEVATSGDSVEVIVSDEGMASVIDHLGGHEVVITSAGFSSDRPQSSNESD